MVSTSHGNHVKKNTMSFSWSISMTKEQMIFHHLIINKNINGLIKWTFGIQLL